MKQNRENILYRAFLGQRKKSRDSGECVMRVKVKNSLDDAGVFSLCEDVKDMYVRWDAMTVIPCGEILPHFSTKALYFILYSPVERKGRRERGLQKFLS